MGRLIILTVVLLSISGSGASDKPGKSDLHKDKDMAGYILGVDKQPLQMLIVGIGESTDSFLARNDKLRAAGLAGGDRVLQLPLMTRVDAMYDDGVMKFHVGCSFTTNIDGNYKYVGIHDVEFNLCDPVVNDWSLATGRTMELAAEFERRNPGIQNIKKFRKTATLAQTEKRWEIPLVDKITNAEFPLTPEQANRFFEKKAREGHIEQLQWRQNTFVLLAGFLFKQTRITFGISKETVWGGDKLSQEQRNMMQYQTIIEFHQLKSLATPCKLTADGQRCQVDKISSP